METNFQQRNPPADPLRFWGFCAALGDNFILSNPAWTPQHEQLQSLSCARVSMIWTSLTEPSTYFSRFSTTFLMLESNFQRNSLLLKLTKISMFWGHSWQELIGWFSKRHGSKDGSWIWFLVPHKQVLGIRGPVKRSALASITSHGCLDIWGSGPERPKTRYLCIKYHIEPKMAKYPSTTLESVRP